MNTHYDKKEWAAGTTRGRQVFNFNYRMLGTESKGWNLLKVVSLREDRDVTERAYIWQSKNDPENELIRVDVAERHNWQQAQESLHEHLMQCMRPDIPRGTKKLAKLGDVVFTAREPQTDISAAISFSRGNVFVSVSSIGEKNMDVSDMASRLDRALNYRPPKKEIEKGKIRAFTPKATILKANEDFVLIKSLKKTASRGEWLKIIVPDGQLSRKDDSLIYASPKGGEKQVATFTMSIE
jgi:hypothetical protein